jgi:hypothetical protein
LSPPCRPGSGGRTQAAAEDRERSPAEDIERLG